MRPELKKSEDEKHLGDQSMYDLLRSELEGILKRTDISDAFIISPVLEHATDMTFYEVFNKMRFVLYQALDQHYENSLPLHYWIGTKTREILLDPMLREKIDDAINHEFCAYGKLEV